MLRFNRNRYRRSRAEINLVPLIDVLTVLIFFCLLTMQFKQVRALSICVPRMDSAGPTPMDTSISVTVAMDGSYYYNGKSVDATELTKMLQLAGESGLHRDLVIIADERVSLKKVAYAMDEARKAKIENIRLQTR